MLHVRMEELRIGPVFGSGCLHCSVACLVGSFVGSLVGWVDCWLFGLVATSSDSARCQHKLAHVAHTSLTQCNMLSMLAMCCQGKMS
jgi:hypothetical protein